MHSTQYSVLNRRTVYVCIFMLIFLTSLVSCAKAAAVQFTQSASGGSRGGSLYESAKLSRASDFAAEEIAFEDDAVDTGSTAAAVQKEAAQRKLIRTGYLTLEVESLAETMQSIEDFVSRYGGFIFTSEETARTVNVTVRVPAAHFDQAMSEAGGIGRIKNKRVETEDVTEQFYDLASRLEAKKILQERYQTYLAEASSVKDLLSIEESLNSVTQELEFMQEQMNRLSGNIEFSRITIFATLPQNISEQGYVLPDTRGQLRAFWGTVLSFFNALLFVLLYVIIFGIPLVILIAFFWWLCFGKIGLVRRLFKKISAGGSKISIHKKE